MNKARFYNPLSSYKYYFTKEGTPKTIIRSNTTKTSLFSNDDRTIKNLKLYYKYYRGDGTVWAAINSIAFNTVMVGHFFESDDDDAKKIISDFCYKIDLDSHLLNATTYALVLGDSFLEIIYKKDGKHISRLKKTDGRTMNINYDDYGDIQSFQQKVAGEKKDPIEPEFICHFNLFPKPDSPYGISLIEPSRDIIRRKIRSDQAITNAMIRHGTPKYVATIGTEKEGQTPPTKTLKLIQDEMKDINEKNEFIIPWNCKIGTIDENGVKGIKDYTDYFQTQLVVGLLCPEEALGMGKGSTEATARVKAILYERMIQSFQLRIARIIEQSLFNKVLEAHGKKPNSVHIKFNSITDEDEAMKAKWMGELMNGFRNSPVKPFTINEIREYFKKSPISEKWANTLKYGIEERDKESVIDNDPEVKEKTKPKKVPKKKPKKKDKKKK